MSTNTGNKATPKNHAIKAQLKYGFISTITTRKAILNNPDDVFFEFIKFSKDSSLYKRVLSSLAKHKFYAPVRTANFLTEINQGFICELIDRAKGVSHE